MYKKAAYSIISVILAVVFFLIIKNYFFTEKKIVFDEQSYNLISNTDLTKYYPKTPEDLIKINNDIIKLVYSRALNETQLIEIIEKQRLLFSEELNRENSVEKHLNTTLEEISEFQKTENSIKEFEVGALSYDKYSDNISMINVKQILESGDFFSLRYYIINENGNWKILAWEYM